MVADARAPNGVDQRARLRELLAARTAPEADSPVSYPQQRLWFLQRLSPSARTYHVEAVSHVRGPLDLAALRRALTGVVTRHAMLRTTFREVDGRPRQVVHPPAAVPLPLVDLSGRPSPEAECERLLAGWSRTSFDLERGPLLRGSVLRLSAQHHVVALYLHHIVADGWSMGILGHELDALYQQESGGRRAELPELPVQYTDYARWQRRRLDGPWLAAELAHWRARLQDLPTLRLPLDHPRPAVQDFEGAHVDLSVPGPVHQRLRRLAAAEGATPFMVLLAGFAALLHRWSGERDLPIGTYLANRSRPELEPLVGFFLNTLVLRVRVDPDRGFRDLVAEVRRVALEAYDHQEVPFELLVEDLAPPRDLSRNPLFQVVCQLNNAPTQDPRANTLEAARAQRAATGFDLGLMLFETASGLAGQFEFSTRLFDPRTVEQLARHLVHLLTAAVGAPDTPVGDLPVMPVALARRLAAATNSTDRAYPWDEGLLDLFASRVAASPEAAAFVVGDRMIRYADLDAASAALAARLAGSGVRPGDAVAVGLDRTAALPTAVLAVLRAGAAWVPLDPTWPAERRAEACRQAGVRVLVGPAGAAPEGGAPERVELVEVDGPATGAEAGAASAPRVGAAPGDPAYVAFTSGSTGRPRGMVCSHGQVLNRLRWMWRRYPWQPGEVAVMKTSSTFVDSVWELFGGLLQGVPTVIVAPADVVDVRALVDILARRRVSRLWLVPALLRTLLEVVPDARTRLPALRLVVASGEDLPRPTYDLFRARLPHCRLVNLYGTTEVWDATWWDPGAGAPPGHRVPIGRPLDNVRTYVLDERGHLCPPGWPGELHVAGAGLALRALGSEPVFVERTVVGRRERLYPTGDRAVLRADLELEFLGRRDGQLKLRGVRLEPGEVEAALYRHPAVVGCAVGLTDASPPRLVAWVECTAPRPDAAELRAHVQALLPLAALPQQIVLLDRLPTTTSGKIDRRRLPDPPPPAAPAAADGSPPRDDLERSLAASWSGLLGTAVTSRDADFFADLGGHSLLAVRALSRVRDEHRVDLPLRVMFERPTVAGLAEAVRAARTDDTAAASPIPRLDRDAYRGGSPP
jgi:amino acid adenylation domain-containing protein